MSVQVSTPFIVSADSRDGKKWLQNEEREFIRMCRHENLNIDEMAARMRRSPDSIMHRLAKIMYEHLDGRTDEASIKEVSDWILPNYSTLLRDSYSQASIVRS
jgi:hypothetical protein